MQKIITLLALLPLFTTAQTWAPIGAAWTYTQGSCCGPDSNVAVVEVVGDTLIGGQLCRNLQMTSGWHFCYQLPRFQYQNNDSLFYWNESAGSFALLFRWDAVPGDTWSTPITGDTLDWTVLDTTSITWNGVSLKQWSVHQESRQWTFFSPIAVVTERLGPATSPFTWTSGACDGESYQDIRCYEDAGFSWLNPQYTQCALSSGIPEASCSTGFSITPSPVQAGEPFTVALPTGAGSARVRLLDTSGRTVLDRPIQGSATFSLTQAGMYLVQLLGAGFPIAPQRLAVR
jgi:hypothetical protein